MRFACQPGCTRCCEQKGLVYLSEDDIVRLAAFVGMSVRAFEKKYVYRTRYTRRLRKPPQSQCPFLTGEGCSVHPAKPVQCSTFPFWPELLEELEQWKETGSWCPGIGKGPLVQITVAKKEAERMRSAHPKMYE